MKKGNLEDMLMAKKPGSGEMSKDEVQAKMDVLQELMDMCKAKMGDSVKNGMDEMQKVSVMAPDKQSLAMGLDKAKELAENPHMEALEESLEDPKEEASETPAEEKAEDVEEMKSPMSSFMNDDEDEDSMFAKKMKK